MTQRREIDRHRRKLCEVREIMDSMKTLAYMETHKLTRFINAQNTLVGEIEGMASDFLHFHPEVLPTIEPVVNVNLLIGSQRGFCGDFNEVLVKHLESSVETYEQNQYTLIAVGQKLHSQLQNMSCDIIYLDGANVAEEIGSVVTSIANSLSTKERHLMSLSVIYHAEDNSICNERLLPPFMHLPENTDNFTSPPILNLSPEEFFLELIDQHLFIDLHRLLYASLKAENQSRIVHLDNAINHLNNKTGELVRKSNALRQEEIIEEIEVILLNESRN